MKNAKKFRGIDEIKHRNHCQCQWLCPDVTMLAGRKLTVLLIIVSKKNKVHHNLKSYLIYTILGLKNVDILKNKKSYAINFDITYVFLLYLHKLSNLIVSMCISSQL